MTMQRAMRGNGYSWCADILFLTGIFAVLFFTLLGSRPLFVPDEGRYAEIAREMAALGDYVTPYLNGVKYFEKPILFYWLGTAAIKIGGLNLWSIRSINALIGLAGCLMTYAAARKLYDRTTGLLAAFILGTSALYFVMSHMISLDIAVTCFLTASLYAFLLGMLKPEGTARRLYIWSAFAAAGLAVLTKGLIGIVFPMMIVGSWIVLMGEWRLIKKLYLPSSLFIFICITAPWHILVGERNPEFFYFYFIQQHFLRYTTENVGHYQPAWFFLPVLIIGFFPWIGFLPQTIAKLFRFPQRAQHKVTWFFLLWAALIFVFFSFSKSKLIPYILPVIPPLAVLVARYLAENLNQAAGKGIRLGYAFLIVLALAVTYCFYSFIHNATLFDSQSAAIYLGISASILVVGIIASFFLASRKLKMAIYTTIATTSAFLLISLAALPAIDTRTILPLTAILKPILQTQDEIITFNQYYQDLPFYLQRRVSILNWRNELAYGMRYQDAHDWMIDDNAFWDRWHSDKRVFVIMGADEYTQLKARNPKEHIYLLGRTPKNALICNQNTEQSLAKSIASRS